LTRPLELFLDSDVSPRAAPPDDEDPAGNVVDEREESAEPDAPTDEFVPLA